MRTIENIREQITPICKKYGVKSVRLFGSYARGEAHERSDIDFFVELGNVRDLFTLSAFRLALIDALQMEVDIVTQLPDRPEFQRELARDEVLVYAA